MIIIITFSIMEITNIVVKRLTHSFLTILRFIIILRLKKRSEKIFAEASLRLKIFVYSSYNNVFRLALYSNYNNNIVLLSFGFAV